MRFKGDESLHIEVADLLRAQGHDALTVFDQGLRGRNDHDIAICVYLRAVCYSPSIWTSQIS